MMCRAYIDITSEPLLVYVCLFRSCNNFLLQLVMYLYELNSYYVNICMEIRYKETGYVLTLIEACVLHAFLFLGNCLLHNYCLLFQLPENEQCSLISFIAILCEFCIKRNEEIICNSKYM